MTVTELPLPIVWLSMKQAAQHANLSISTLERAMRAGELEYSGGGRGVVVRIRVDKLDEWLAQRGKR